MREAIKRGDYWVYTNGDIVDKGVRIEESSWDNINVHETTYIWRHDSHSNHIRYP